MIFPYNQTHFEAVGLDPDTSPSTWDEVHEFGKSLTHDDQYGFALMGGRQIQAMCTYAAIFFGLAGKGFTTTPASHSLTVTKGGKRWRSWR